MGLQKINQEKEAQIKRERATEKERSITTKVGKAASYVGGKVKNAFYMTDEEYSRKQAKNQPAQIASPERIVDLADDGKINYSEGKGGITINVGATSPQEMVRIEPPQPEKRNFAQKLKSGASQLQAFAATHGNSNPLGNLTMMGNPNMRDPLSGMLGGGGGHMSDPLAGLMGGGGSRGDPLAGLTGGFGGGRGGGNPLAALTQGMGGRKRGGDPLAGLCGGFGGKRSKDPLAGLCGFKTKKTRKKKRRRY